MVVITNKGGRGLWTLTMTTTTLVCFCLILMSSKKICAQSGGLGFVGNYPDVIDRLLNVLRRTADGSAKDEFIVHNQLTNEVGGIGGGSPVIHITCEDEEGVTKIILYSGQVYGYVRDHRKYGQDFDLCCKFQWNDRHIPLAHDTQYVHLSRTWRAGGGLRHIYVNTDGIYSEELVGGLVQNFYQSAGGGINSGRSIGGGNGIGRRDWLAGWDEQGSYGICEKNHEIVLNGINERRDYDDRSTAPYLSSYLLGTSGYKCASLCRPGSGDRSSHWCYTVVTSGQTAGHWDYCSPNQEGVDYFNGGLVGGTASQTISSRGLRCKGGCVNYSENGSKYNYFFCLTSDLFSVDGVIKFGWDYCAPRFGRDYYNRECQNRCDFYGENYKWCRVKGGSWGYC